MLIEKTMAFVSVRKGETKGEEKKQTRNAVFNYCDGVEDTNFAFYTNDEKLVERIDKLEKFKKVMVILNLTNYKDETTVRLYDVILDEVPFQGVPVVAEGQAKLEGVERVEGKKTLVDKDGGK